MFHRWVGALVGLALFAIAGTASAQTTRVVLTFVAAGFGEGAPQDPVSGTFTYDTDSTTGEIVNLVSVSLTISGHTYSLAEVGFESPHLFSADIIGGVLNGLDVVGFETDDFWIIWDRVLGVGNQFAYSTAETSSFVKTFSFTSFSLDASEDNNNPPVAQDDRYIVYPGLEILQVPGPQGPEVLENDTSTSPMTAKIVTFPSAGGFLGPSPGFKPDGSFSYVAFGNDSFFQFGGDSFTYKAINEFGESNIATVTIRTATKEDIEQKDKDRNEDLTMTEIQKFCFLSKQLKTEQIANGLKYLSCYSTGTKTDFALCAISAAMFEALGTNDLPTGPKQIAKAIFAATVAAFLMAVEAPVAVVVVTFTIAEMAVVFEYMDETAKNECTDPPDFLFTEPYVVTHEVIAADFGLGANNNARVNAVLNGLLDAAILSKTSLVSLERYQGALIADDEVNALARYNEFLSANESIDDVLRDLGRSISDLKRVCENCSIVPDPQVLTDLQASIVNDGGLGGEVETLLVNAGFSLQEIDAIEQRILALSVDDLPNVSLNDVIDLYARMLRPPAMPWLNLLLLDD